MMYIKGNSEKKKEIMQNIWETNEKQYRYNPQEVMKVQR